MIAAALGYRFVDESTFSTYDVLAWRQILESPGVVVQCPYMLKEIVDDPPASVLVVLMRRCVDDIRSSEERIGWAWHYKELEPFGLLEGDSATLKYQYWDANPPPNSIEVQYESLAGHWAFVEKSRRTGFTSKQTSTDRRQPWLLSRADRT